MNEILKPFCLVLLLLLAGCNGMATDPSSTTHAPTSRTTVDTVVSNRTTSTTTLPTKTCTVTNETKDGSIVAVRPTMHRDDREVIVMTQWNATANVSNLDVTLDSSRLFEARSSVLDGENVSGFGRPVGTAPLAGQLQVKLYDDGRQVGQYNASMVCER
ncbi:hypothetical protein ZOD2009_05612 [Haladaptatus paucihalophilus DX253]|uniref:Lipoprotein n=1 Tax=Haladaptatus paucihalophilus DX253 TaxID=797209 RepID=E7QQQ2_HALPU|nr:hypothetical protein [Haladaptatus paucihalophilus]EFW93316.1 hypothetical protein ZOD2009_05612 [Haladaptatus paucihalophilus DX253]SHK51173.1 hypothetical protein SAMN05444342_1505 [Haladaptatus paucihalophilus DX253]